jgi:hypothetical protein
MLSTNLIIHRCIDLGSIKFSVNKRSGSIKSEFTYCSNSFARALVIGPILISLDFFGATSSSSKGVGYNGGVIGMSSPTSPFERRQPRRCKVFTFIWCQISNVETIADTILSCRKIYLVGIIIDLGKNLVRTSAMGYQHESSSQNLPSSIPPY